MGQALDRSELCAGEWDADIAAHPQKEYVFYMDGYKCRIVRSGVSWTWCGYVHLPVGHPDYRKCYTDLEKDVLVHGALTYGCGNGVFGFDCHHQLDGDISPADETMKKKEPTLFPPIESLYGRYHYWTFEDVERELKQLVLQFQQRNPSPCKAAQ